MFLRRLMILLGLPLVALAAETEEAGQPESGNESPVEDKARTFSMAAYARVVDVPGPNIPDIPLVAETLESGEIVARPEPQKPQSGSGSGGMLMTVRRWVIDTGGAGHGGVDEQGVSYGSGEGHLALGYLLAQNERFRVYPLVGIGGAGGSAEVALQGSETTKEVGQSTGTLILTPGLGIDFRLKLWRFGLLVGLRMGMKLSVGTESGAVPFFRVIVGPQFG